MNSANAFTFAISGSYTENQMQQYQQYVNQSAAAFQSVGGWLAQQATKAVDNFSNFMDSRAWEMGKRLLNNQDGEYVGRFEIGYLGTVHGLQGAQGFMRDYIMAHKGLHQDWLDGNIEGYDGEFHARCRGIGEENIFYRRAMHGLLNLEMVNDAPQMRHTHYHESLGGGLSFRERVDIQKTWTAVDHHRAKALFDVTSPSNQPLKNAKDPGEAV